MPSITTLSALGGLGQGVAGGLKDILTQRLAEDRLAQVREETEARRIQDMEEAQALATHRGTLEQHAQTGAEISRGQLGVSQAREAREAAAAQRELDEKAARAAERERFLNDPSIPAPVKNSLRYVYASEGQSPSGEAINPGAKQEAWKEQQSIRAADQRALAILAASLRQTPQDTTAGERALPPALGNELAKIRAAAPNFLDGMELFNENRDALIRQYGGNPVAAINALIGMYGGAPTVRKADTQGGDSGTGCLTSLSWAVCSRTRRPRSRGTALRPRPPRNSRRAGSRGGSQLPARRRATPSMRSFWVEVADGGPAHTGRVRGD